MGKKISARAYAAWRKKRGMDTGLTHTAVYKAIHSGRITERAWTRPGRSYLIDPELADADWLASTNDALQRKKPEKEESLPLLDGVPETVSEAATSELGRMAELRRQDVLVKTELNRLKLEEAQGKVIPLEQVEREANEAGRRLKAVLLKIPARVCSIFAADTDSKSIEAALDHEIRQALDQLSNELETEEDDAA